MKRWPAITLVAIAVIVLGCVIAVVIDRRALASTTVELGGSTVTLEISERDGAVYVAAIERKPGANGRVTKMFVGNAKEIGVENASIDGGVNRDQMQLRVGNKVVDFAFETWSFSPSKLAPK